MSKEFKFFIYLLERYAARNGETADVTLNRLKEHGLCDYAVDMYELYHVESLENAFADLDGKLAATLSLPSTSRTTSGIPCDLQS